MRFQVLPPSDFVGFLFFLFLRLVALRVSLWGWWGSLAAFSLPPALVAFLLSGLVGSPCCVFPVFSPRFLGGRGGVFVSPAISCILHLL